MSTVKKQHYVWKAYLKRWSLNAFIAMLHIPTKEVKMRPLNDVAQVKYFYTPVKLDPNEYQQALIFIEDLCKPRIIDPISLKTEFIRLLEAWQNAALELELNDKKPTSKDKYLSKLSNLIEDLHGRIEIMGSRLINAQSTNELYAIFNAKEHKHELFVFMFTQFFRTKSKKESLLNIFNSNPKDRDFLNKLSPLIALWTSWIIAEETLYTKGFSLQLISNNSSIDFLTSDQPFVNLHGIPAGQSVPHDKFDLYYPLSPKLAIIIYVNRSHFGEVHQCIIHDQKDIQNLNSLMITQAGDYIFSNHLKNLEDLILCRN